MRFNEKELVFLSRQPSERAAELGMKGPKKGDGEQLTCLICNHHHHHHCRSVSSFICFFLPPSYEEETGQAHSQFPVLLSHLRGRGENLNFFSSKPLISFLDKWTSWLELLSFTANRGFASGAVSSWERRWALLLHQWVKYSPAWLFYKHKTLQCGLVIITDEYL